MDPQSYITSWRGTEAQLAIKFEHRRQAAERPEEQFRRRRTPARHRRIGVAVRLAR